ncbi:MAG: hypothetical protein HFJ52_04075 [Clostridia bacterium]|nr:hypothetical protein [Clostridia bacterium]
MSEEKKKARIFIREALKKEIDKVVNTYFLNAHNDTEYPYAVSDIKESNDEVHIPYFLEIELQDATNNTTKIEEICDDLKSLLDRKRETTEHYAYVIFFDSCNTKIDEEKFIKIRVLTFEIKMYEY